MSLSWAQNSFNAYADDQRRTCTQLQHSPDQVALNERLNNELTVAVNWFREKAYWLIQRNF